VKLVRFISAYYFDLHRVLVYIPGLLRATKSSFAPRAVSNHLMLHTRLFSLSLQPPTWHLALSRPCDYGQPPFGLLPHCWRHLLIIILVIMNDHYPNYDFWSSTSKKNSVRFCGINGPSSWQEVGVEIRVYRRNRSRAQHASYTRLPPWSRLSPSWPRSSRPGKVASSNSHQTRFCLIF
jgi:hypothetical protein